MRRRPGRPYVLGRDNDSELPDDDRSPLLVPRRPGAGGRARRGDQREHADVRRPAGRGPRRCTCTSARTRWIVLAGRITVFLGEEEHDLEAGQAAFGPRGVPHSYLVRSPRARLAAVYLPSGIDQHFAANGTPVVPGEETPAPFDIDAVVASAATYGLLVAGPPPNPVTLREEAP
jgi:hypothetical protein